jgi:hypothetical protein
MDGSKQQYQNSYFRIICLQFECNSQAKLSFETLSSQGCLKYLQMILKLFLLFAFVCEIPYCSIFAKRITWVVSLHLVMKVIGKFTD